MTEKISTAELVVGNTKISVEIPTPLFDTVSRHVTAETLKLYSYNSEAIIDVLRGLIPEEHRPPTHRQLGYAQKISRVLRIELPEDALFSTQKCSEFLDQHVPEFQKLQEQQSQIIIKNKALISQATRVERWQVAENMLKTGANLEAIADEMGVKTPTIEKYIRELEEWRGIAKANNTYEIVMNLIERRRNGEDIYELYNELVLLPK